MKEARLVRTHSNTVIYVASRESSTKHDRDSESLSESGRVTAPGDAEDHEMVQPAEVPVAPPRSTARYLSVPPSKARGISMTDEKGHLFQMSGLGSFDTHSRNSNSFTSSAINKADYPVEFPPHIGARAASQANDVKPAEPSNINYMTTEYVSPPVDEPLSLRNAQLQTPLATPQAVGNFNPWTSYPQAMFSPVDYSGGPNQGVPQQLLPHQVSLMPTAPQAHGVNVHQPHGLLPLPDLHGARVQPQFEDLSLGPPAFRTGSLSHPHLLQQRDNGIDGSMHQFK